MELRRFDPQHLSAGELAALHHFTQTIDLERTPDAPPSTLEQLAGRLTNIPAVVEVSLWALWDGDEVVGRSACVLWATGDNPHLAHLEISVLPKRRRQGAGTRLLRVMSQHAWKHGRRTLLIETTSTVPAGEAFAGRFGFEAGLIGRESEVRLAEVDRSTVRSWIEHGERSCGAFELGFWEGRYPEERLEEAARMYDAFALAPQGDLELEDTHYTAHQMRELDEMYASRGTTRWTCWVRDRATGRIAGFSEIFIKNHTPHTVDQGLTVVYPEYRNRGIGRWLKLAMVEKLQTEVPEARVIRIGNAEVNEPMLKINSEMGFRPVAVQMIWQAPIDVVEGHLAERGRASGSLTGPRAVY